MKRLRDMITKRHLYIIGTITAIAVAVVAVRYFNTSGGGAMPALKRVETKKLAAGLFRETISLSGTVKAVGKAEMHAQATGTLRIHARPGAKVPAGTLIASVESVQVEKNLELSLNDLKIAKDQYERSRKLYEAGTASKQSHEQKKADLNRMEKDVGIARIQSEKTRLIAPFDGEVGVYKAEEGGQVREGDFVVTFFDPDSLRVDFDVPAPHLPVVKAGQEIIIGGDVTSQIGYVQKVPDETGYMAPAFAPLPKNTGRFAAGTAVEVEVVTASREHVLSVPFDAVFIKDGKQSVYTVEDHQTVLKPVTVRTQSKDRLEIGEGLREGEEVVIRGVQRLQPGEPVCVATENDAVSCPDPAALKDSGK